MSGGTDGKVHRNTSVLPTNDVKNDSCRPPPERGSGILTITAPGTDYMQMAVLVDVVQIVDGM